MPGGLVFRSAELVFIMGAFVAMELVPYDPTELVAPELSGLELVLQPVSAATAMTARRETIFFMGIVGWLQVC